MTDIGIRVLKALLLSLALLLSMQWMCMMMMVISNGRFMS